MKIALGALSAVAGVVALVVALLVTGGSTAQADDHGKKPGMDRTITGW